MWISKLTRLALSVPPVGRIRAVLLPNERESTDSDRSNVSKWYQLEVPFVDAMHLLALLQGAKDDVRL